MKVAETPVTAADLTGEQIRVTSGLEEGWMIAATGVHYLREGMTVRRFTAQPRGQSQ
jgi:hypothetical protein